MLEGSSMEVGRDRGKWMEVARGCNSVCVGVQDLMVSGSVDGFSFLFFSLTSLASLAVFSRAFFVDFVDLMLKNTKEAVVLFESCLAFLLLFAFLFIAVEEYDTCSILA